MGGRRTTWRTRKRHAPTWRPLMAAASNSSNGAAVERALAAISVLFRYSGAPFGARARRGLSGARFRESEREMRFPGSSTTGQWSSPVFDGGATQLDSWTAGQLD